MPVVLQYRGACVESEHPVSAVALRDGAVAWRAGFDLETTFRSACKPFQLSCSLDALGDPDVTEEQLAVGAASHSAEPVHVGLVESVLARFGASPDDLRCGAHAPIHVPSAEAVIRSGGRYRDIHNNCSGKHAFMLSAAMRNGWDTDYRAPSHPLQQRILQRLTAWMDHAPNLATDGCGVPTFMQPLSVVARAWERVAVAMDDVSRGAPRDVWDERLGRVGRAMAKHPELTSGTGRLDLDVVRAAQEPMAVKVGAMGLFCIALPARRMGVAVKVHSGVAEALPALIAWTLSQAAPGAWVAPEAWEALRVRNVAGHDVGRWMVG